MSIVEYIGFVNNIDGDWAYVTLTCQNTNKKLLAEIPTIELKGN